MAASVTCHLLSMHFAYSKLL